MYNFKKISFIFALLLTGIGISDSATTYVFRQALPGNPVPVCNSSGSKSFTTPGIYQLTVPTGCTFEAVIEGAGGGNAAYGIEGGTGGSVSFSNLSTNQPLTIVVGEAGSVAFSSSAYSGGTGGSYSLVAAGSTILGVAGGGGGAGGYGGHSITTFVSGGDGGNPGSSGVLAPNDYQGCLNAGGGATDSAVGPNGSLCYQNNEGSPIVYDDYTAGASASQSSTFSDTSGADGSSSGDDGNGGGGGGGGGYYGGGTATDGGDYDAAGGGGGGSSYVISTATNVSEITGGGAPAETNGSVSINW